MQVSDKLIRPLTEAKYLNADNVSRYRCIMRIFFEHYEKLNWKLYSYRHRMNGKKICISGMVRIRNWYWKKNY